MSLSRHGRVEKPLLKGFTSKGMHTAEATSRRYSASTVSNAEVSRADGASVHGRGKVPGVWVPASSPERTTAFRDHYPITAGPLFTRNRPFGPLPHLLNERPFTRIAPR
jgi:hypothetical protein